MNQQSNDITRILQEDHQLGYRLRWSRNRLNLSLKALGDMLGVSATAVEWAESGKTQKPKWLAEAATALGVPYEWLAGRAPFSDILQAEQTLRKEAAHATGQADTGKSAPSPASLEALGLTGNPQNYRIIEVVGDSMFPDFRHGDRVIIDLSDTSPTPPGIFLFFDGAGEVLKRVESLPDGKVRLSAINPTYLPMETTRESANLRGRAVLKMQKV